MNKEITPNIGSLPDIRIENETSNGRTSSQSSSCDSSSCDSVFIVSVFIVSKIVSIAAIFYIKNKSYIECL